MKFNAVLVLGTMLSISLAGFVYATTSNEPDDQQVVALKRTVNQLQQRVERLEVRVDEVSKPKLEKINGGSH
jgi:hypothetical protein